MTSGQQLNGRTGLPPVGANAPVVPPVIREHLDEIAFLAIQRRKLLFATDVPLSSILRHDERIAAHWDALVIAAPASVKLALERMEEFDPWDTYTSARVWMEIGNPKGSEVLDRISKFEPIMHGPWREALRQTSKKRIAELFPVAAFPSSHSQLAAVLVYAFGAHDMLPDSVAASAAFNTDPALRFQLARALGWSRSTSQADALLKTLLADPDGMVRRAALWSFALRSHAAGGTVPRSRVSSGAFDYFDFRVLSLFGSDEDLQLLRAHLPPDSAEFARLQNTAPWSGAPEEEPMEIIWRSLFRYSRPEFDWLRNEIPDGFFEAELREDAVPGE